MARKAIYTPEEAYQRKLESLRKAGAKWRAKNSRKEYYKQYDKERYTPEIMMWRNAKARAAKKGVPFSIGHEDVVITNLCPVCEREMKTGGKGGGPCSPSLDRVIPKKGYVKGNVKVICKSCNSVKSDATVEQLKSLVEYIERNS